MKVFVIFEQCRGRDAMRKIVSTEAIAEAFCDEANKSDFTDGYYFEEWDVDATQR